VPQNGDGVNWKGVGVGAGTVAGNVLYIPAKVVYGILGGIAGGAGYVLTGGNQQVSNTIWRSSLGGDYVLTPDMVEGKKPVHFSGPTQTAPDSSGSAVTGSADANASAPAITPPPSYSAAPSSETTAGSYKSGTSSSSSIAATGSGTSHLDSGAGPVGGGGLRASSGPSASDLPPPPDYGVAPQASSHRHTTTPSANTGALPDTSIE
jgi:hypothetical protein